MAGIGSKKGIGAALGGERVHKYVLRERSNGTALLFSVTNHATAGRKNRTDNYLTLTLSSFFICFLSYSCDNSYYSMLRPMEPTLRKTKIFLKRSIVVAFAPGVAPVWDNLFAPNLLPTKRICITKTHSTTSLGSVPLGRATMMGFGSITTIKWGRS